MFGSFGATEADVRATDFYRFFHLAEAARSAPTAGSATSYRPTGPFGDLVTFAVGTAADGAIVELTLHVGRSFVEDPRNGIFARDVVASFVREAAANEGHEDGIAALLHELWTRPLTRPQNWNHAVAYTDENPLPPMPRRPGDFSGVFGVYCGSDAAATTRLRDTYLHVSNDHVAGIGTFTASFTPAV